MASEEQQQPQRREEPADECLHKTKVVQFLGRTTPIILQNENGPCPLLAICNVLLLKNNLNLSPDIAEVSQQKLLSLVAERLIDSNSNINNKDAGYVENQQQNISDAIDLLPCLATGIDVNIKFRRIGDFEFTRECAIFDLLDIPLYHGWIVDPQDSETANAIGSKSYNALVGELVALDSRNMEGEPKSTPEEDCIDFAAATTATLGVPSPSLSRARSFEDSPHSISDNQTVRKGDLQEEAELSRILKLSEAELSTTVDDSLIVNAIGGISIHSDSVVVNTNGEISVSSGASSYPNKCMPVPLVETLEVHTGGTDQNFHQQEAAISDDYNALSRDKNNLPSSQTTPAEGVCSLSNTDGGSHINQPTSEESRMHFPSDDVVDKTNGENLVQNENAPSPSTRRDPISADESSVDILGGDEKIQKQFTSTANVHEQTDNQSACGTTEASGLSTTNTDLSGGRRLNVVVSADFTPSVDDGEPIYEGEECILDSNTTIYEDREPMYEGEVVLAEQADKDSVDSCNIGFKDELTPQQGELVRNFLKNNANQLTVYGLFCLRDNLKERELCVFFRNNHFSTMFKLDGDLYLLATDQGYINQPDLVWEKLNEVNGDSVFMTSNFKEFKVESHSSGTWDEQNAMASTADYLASIDNSAQGASDLNSDLQLAIALQQQEFEQQPQRQNMQQPSSSGNSRLITGPQNSGKVILIFSVNMSGFFQGYAQMMSSVGWRRDNVWSQGSGGNNPWGHSFKVKWLRLHDLPFQKTLHLKNPLNDYKPVKISRDCQELSQEIGEALCELLDGKTDVGDNLRKNDFSGDDLPPRRPFMEPSCSLPGEEYNLSSMHMTWTPMLYPSLLYQHKAEANRFHLAHQRSTGPFLPENLPISSGPSKVTRVKHPRISGNFTSVQVDHDMSSGFDVWNMSAERSPLASTLTEDDILEMSYEEYLEAHSRSNKKLSQPAAGPLRKIQESTNKEHSDSYSRPVADRCHSRKRTHHSSSK